MPEVVRVHGFRFFFFSREGREPRHVHVEQAERTPSFSWSRLSLRSRAGFALPSCARFTLSLNKTSRRLSLPWMSTLASKPVADAVDVSCTDDELVVTLADGRRVSAPLEWFPRLLHATPAQRAKWRLIGHSIGIHWEDTDEDISVRTLLAA